MRAATEAQTLTLLGARLSEPVFSLDTGHAKQSVRPPSTRMSNRLADRVGERQLATIAGASLSGQTAPDSLDPVEHLRFLAAQQQEINKALQNEVVVLLNGGHSWTTIRALGLTRQGARQRYRHLTGGADGTCSCGSRQKR